MTSQINSPKQLSYFFNLLRQYQDLNSDFMYGFTTLKSISNIRAKNSNLFQYEDEDICYIYTSDNKVMLDVIIKNPSKSRNEVLASIVKSHDKTVFFYDFSEDNINFNKDLLSNHFSDRDDISVSFFGGVYYNYPSSILDVNSFYGSSSHTDRDVRKAVRFFFDTERESTRVILKHISQMTLDESYRSIELVRVWKADKVRRGYKGIISSDTFFLERLSSGKLGFNHKDIPLDIPMYLIHTYYKDQLLTEHIIEPITDKILVLPFYKPVRLDSKNPFNKIPMKVVRAVSTLKYYLVAYAVSNHLNLSNYTIYDKWATQSNTKSDSYNLTHHLKGSFRSELETYKMRHHPILPLPKMYQAFIKESKKVASKRSIF